MSELVTVGAGQAERVQGQAGPRPQRWMRARSRRPRAFLLTADLGVAEATFLVALFAASRLGFRVGISSVGVEPLPILLAVVFPLIAGISGLYRVTRLTSWRTQAGVGLRVLAWSVGISVGALFLFAQEIPWGLRFVLFLYQGLLGIWLLAIRPMTAVLLYRHFDSTADRPERVLLVGADSVACDIARSLVQRSERVRIVGFTDPEPPIRPKPGPFYACTLDGISDLARELEVDLVVVARPDLPRDQVVRLSDVLVGQGRRVHVVSNVFNKLVDSVPFETHNGVPLVAVGQTPLRDGNEALKRIFDLLGTIAGGILILPLIVTISLLVKLGSPGPVLFRQTRLGRRGRPFTFYKFRTMKAGADDSQHREYVRDLVRNGGAAATDKSGRKIYKLVDDARVTAIGRFLRRTSLDELPQLINVLRGEMSLIGPRPCLSFEYELYQDWQRRRLDVTPGMTGLWQVTGRSYVTFEDMVLLDLFYIANWSLGMDFRILFRTIPVVIWGKGGV